jgi:hypothetical protein
MTLAKSIGVSLFILSVALQYNSLNFASNDMNRLKDGRVLAGSSIENGHQIPDLNIMGYFIHSLLIATSIYLIFWGFRVFRLMMTILGFHVSYYLVLFVCSEKDIKIGDNLGRQIAVLAICVIIGFIFAILCYMLDRINFLLFGLAIATVVSLFAAQFFIDFNDDTEVKILLGIFLVSTVVFSILSFLILDHFMIWGSAAVGAAVTVINFGVIIKDFTSFENRQHDFKNDYKDFMIYLLAAGLLLITGIITQYYLRSRIIKRLEDSQLEEIRGTSFLN